MSPVDSPRLIFASSDEIMRIGLTPKKITVCGGNLLRTQFIVLKRKY